MSEQITESRAMSTFRAKTDTAMTRIKDLKQFRESDKMIDFVFTIGREMFDKELDTMSIDWLTNTGGKLTAIYAYLGNKASYARAKRDIYEQKKDEVAARIALDEYPNTEKITVAKARAKLEIIELDEDVAVAESEKNNMEHLLDATKTMIMFLQSSMSIKKSERFIPNAMQ